VKVPATILANITRLLLLAFSGKPVLLLHEWHIYLAVCVASFIGAGLGSCVRERVPKQQLLFLLYLLLWFTVADLLKVIKDPTKPRAIVFYAASALLLLLMSAAAAAPLKFTAALQGVKNICACGVCADVAPSSPSRSTSTQINTASYNQIG
jgi:hypothetical protein